MAAPTPSSSSVATPSTPLSLRTATAVSATNQHQDPRSINSPGASLTSPHPPSQYHHHHHHHPDPHPPPVFLHPASVAATDPSSSTGETSSRYYHPQQQHQHSHQHVHPPSHPHQHPHQHHQQHVPASYSHFPLNNHQHYSYSSSLPADSFPRTLSRTSTYDQDARRRQSSSSSSFVQPSSYRPLHQSTYPPASSSSHSASEASSSLGSNSSSASDSVNHSNISSNLPEYSYPMTPSQRLHRDHYRPLQLSHHRPHREHQQTHHQPSHGQLPNYHSQGPSHGNPKEHHFLLKQAERPHLDPSEQQKSPQTRIPPPIRTRWSDGVSRDCPPLSLQSGLSHSQSIRSADSRISPATPRSVSAHVPMSILRQSSSDSYFAESPLDYREPNSLRHTIASTLRGKYDHEEHDMERCSEPEDARKGECEDEDEYEDDSILQGQIKKQKLGAIDLRLSLGTKTMPHSRNTQRSAVEQGADGAGKARAGTNDGGAEGEAGEEGRQSALTSTSSSRKQSMSGSVHGDEAPACKSKKGKVAAQKRGLRRASLPVSSEALDRIEDDAQAETGPQSLAGRGLRIYAQRVCEQVEAKRSTSYNELVHDLFGGNAGENVDELPEAHGQENIRRRVYDALNVLEALDIISFVNKDIHWVGIEQSSVIHEVTESQTAAPALAQGQGPGDGGDDESEEPEDDDMEIEKLQREVDAMRLQNNLEQAKLQDQLTRHVQVLNLVKRNKRREAKDEEREERRRQRKEEKRVRAMMIDQDPTMTDVGPLGASDHNDDTRQKSDRPRRRRIHRHSSGQPEGQVEASGADGMEEEQEGEEEEEEARRRRKQERRERRERKDKRAQRRLEKEQEKVQLPFVVVRMPGYTGQSSDSESSISVMRSVRADQKSRRSDKGKRQGSTGQETTMVEIQIPQQDELSIISDTEILGDLGFNTVSVNELETMLPKSLVDAVQYTVNAEEDLRSSRENSTAAGNGVQAATSITVRGGFEREIVRAASEDASSNA